jgi:hypothetical protein
MMVISFPVFELLKEGEVLVVPTDNPMTEKEVWLAFRDVVHGLEYRELKTNNWLERSERSDQLTIFWSDFVVLSTKYLVLSTW